MEEPDPPRKIGKLLPLTLTKALQKTLPKVYKAPRIKYLQKLFSDENIPDNPTDISLVNFLLQHPSAAQKLQQKYQFRWVVIKQWLQAFKKEVCLVYNASHAILKNESSPIHYFLLNKKNALRQHTINDTQPLPNLTLSCINKSLLKHQQPLWQLLSYDNNPSQLNTDPQNTTELETFLKKFTPPKTLVQVFFVPSTGKKKPTLWTESDIDLSQPLEKVIKVYAWTDQNYQTAYAKDPDRSLVRAKQRGQKMDEKLAQYQETIQQLEEEEASKTSNPCQANNASSINLSHSSLNLAYNLGLISTRQELKGLSDGLADTLASLYIFVDEKDHLRHITYCDREDTFSVQVTCFDDKPAPSNSYQQGLENERREKAAQTMLQFWQKVWQRRQHWIKQRQCVLKPLMDQLDGLLSMEKKKTMSPFSRCKTNLKTVIHHQHLCMFSSQESHLHAVKFFVADFGYHTIKRFKGVTVKSQSDGTLTMLHIPGLAIVNLHTYFGTKSDADFFAQVFYPQSYDPSSTIIKHQGKHLERQSYSEKEHTTMWMHCKQAGKKCAQHILEYWKTFCQKILAHFSFEVHGQTNLPSASYLAFQCIWTAYAQKAGPMAQGLEKCKPYYETLLRENSRGGLMFSAEDALDQGDNLWPNLPDTSIAQAIAEMDLVSAYGYAASQAYMPSGFCTGFATTTGPSLEKLDPKMRHKTFEFQAVYKVLHNLIYQEDVAIRSVYSNFSPLGLFYLGSYPIDLVVVTEKGQLILYQMDGQWAHGCPARCEPLEHYANDQTFEQVRHKTNQRDKDTWDWINALNLGYTKMKDCDNADAFPRFKYKIIYDCHTDGFFSGSLNFQYYNVPELAQMVQGYKVIDALGNKMTPKKLELLMNDAPSKDFTFIAKATLNISNHSNAFIHPEGGPLIVYEPRQDKYTRHSLSYCGTVLLTRDYFEWLLDSFATVQVQELEWVLFYKTEPIFNEIYHSLVHLRSSTQDPVLICFLKRIINLSCGFFGVHTSQHNKTTYRLVDGPPSNYQFFRHCFNVDYTADVGTSSYMLLETKAWPKKSLYQKVSSSAIPMFVSIIEYGKLRLIQTLNFLQRHISPRQFRFLYSNIDNLVFALGNANTLLEAIHPHGLHSFNAEKNQFLVEEEKEVGVKNPGKAKLEWIRNGPCGWKFITLRTQHYCLVVSNQDNDQGHLHKTSGWTHLSSPEAFALAKQIWEGNQVKLSQKRRINKKCNMDTHQVEFTYRPKPL